MTNTAPKTGTWQDITPTLKGAAAIANHPTFGQVDIMKWHDDGTANIRYMSTRAFRTFRKRVATADLTDITYR